MSFETLGWGMILGYSLVQEPANITAAKNLGSEALNLTLSALVICNKVNYMYETHCSLDVTK
eukprot:3814128-Amphidinium_carterae.1